MHTTHRETQIFFSHEQLYDCVALRCLDSHPEGTSICSARVSLPSLELFIKEFEWPYTLMVANLGNDHTLIWSHKTHTRRRVITAWLST